MSAINSHSLLFDMTTLSGNPNFFWLGLPGSAKAPVSNLEIASLPSAMGAWGGSMAPFSSKNATDLSRFLAAYTFSKSWSAVRTASADFA